MDKNDDLTNALERIFRGIPRVIKVGGKIVASASPLCPNCLRAKVPILSGWHCRWCGHESKED
jgi:hypothetical protein